MARLAYPCFQALQSPPKLCQLGRGHQYQAELLYNHTSKFEVLGSGLLLFSSDYPDKTHLLAFQQLRESPVYLLCVQIQTQLPDNQAPSRFQQPSVGAEQFQEVVHEYSEVILFRTSGYLSYELEVVFYNFLRGVGEGLEEGRECTIVHGKDLVIQGQSSTKPQVSRGIPSATSDAA